MPPKPTPTAPKRILGIDPGTRRAGFALIEQRHPGLRHPRNFRVLDVGVLDADAKMPLTERIGALHERMHGLIQQLAPTVCVLEAAFFGQNPQSALKLGLARGAFIAAIARCSLPCADMTPAEVKRTVAGSGAADKNGVALALRHLLGFERGQLPFDATDALAVALSYGLTQ